MEILCKRKGSESYAIKEQQKESRKSDGKREERRKRRWEGEQANLVQ